MKIKSLTTRRPTNSHMIERNEKVKFSHLVQEDMLWFALFCCFFVSDWKLGKKKRNWKSWYQEKEGGSGLSTGERNPFSNCVSQFWSKSKQNGVSFPYLSCLKFLPSGPKESLQSKTESFPTDLYLDVSSPCCIFCFRETKTTRKVGVIVPSVPGNSLQPLPRITENDNLAYSLKNLMWLGQNTHTHTGDTQEASGQNSLIKLKFARKFICCWLESNICWKN